MFRKIWTISNFFSVARVFLVFPVGYCLLTEFPHHRLWTALLLLVAIATDFFDGYFARLFHQVTEFGKVVDPIADKIVVAFYAVLLTITHALPVWYLVLLLSRDILIFLGGLYIHQKKKIIPQSNWAGKIAVSLVALVFFLKTIQLQELEGLYRASFWLSVVVLVWSFILYTKRLFIGRDVQTD